MTQVNILTIGDIVGRPGKMVLSSVLDTIKKENNIHLTIANGENLSGGMGISKKCFEELRLFGVDGVTMGNHVWRDKAIFSLFEERKPIIRPANYPIGTVGKEYLLMDVEGFKIGVFIVVGRSFIEPLDCPFQTADRIIEQLQKNNADIILAEIHAEATAEKIAFGRYLDGRVGAVFGSHTHVQTSDLRIFPKGTGYITDLGMTGPQESVIGIKISKAIRRFVTRMPASFDVASGPAQVNAAVWRFEDKKLVTATRIMMMDLE